MRPSAEDLDARAAAADDPAAATRLRREAAAAREAERRVSGPAEVEAPLDETELAIAVLARAVEEAEGAELVRLGDRVGAIFGAVLARLHGAPRLESLERARRARGGGR